MNFKTIFKDEELIREATIKSNMTKKMSDCNGVAGGQFEIEIVKLFNKSNEDYKIFNVKALESVIGLKGEGIFDFGKYKTFSNLLSKTKETFSSVSCADLFLFQKNDRFVLKDAISVKTSFPSEPKCKVYIHNDSNGEIHRKLRGSFVHNSKKRITENIGPCVLVVKREERVKIYYFNGEFKNLKKLLSYDNVNKHGDLSLGLKSEKKSQCVFISINRDAKTANPTSFRRGLKISASKTKKRSAFYFLDKVKCFEVLSSFAISEQQIIGDLIKDIHIGE